MNSIVILGSSGFIGSTAVRYFLDQGYCVTGIDLVADRTLGEHARFNFLPSSITHEVLHQVLTHNKPAAIINAAGRASVGASFENPAADFIENTATVLTILDCIRLYSPQTNFVLLSSAAVYGNPAQLPVRETDALAPISPYGFHKMQAEIIAKEYHQCFGISSIVLRIFSCFGEGQRKLLLWDLCEKASMQSTLLLKGRGKETRDFIHAKDVVLFIAHLLNNKLANHFEVYNVASGLEWSIKQVAAHLVHCLEYNNEINFEGIVNTGNPDNWLADISKMRSTGFNPTIEIETGIKRYADWYLQQRKI
ncbi:MAG TPA: NAD-dependent epimerase/dehydratase family protein [Ferruginibacter sp.]|nr:NAD-dependent epimerase/dehydratase family protein [Ferruginibacter sp.]